MKKILFLFLALSSLSLSSFTNPIKPVVKHVCDESQNLDFTLVNMTGYDISDVYVSPTSMKEWGDDIMGQDVVLNGESVDVSFHPAETDRKWDIYVTWVGYDASEDVYWVGFDLSKISEIALYYDEDTGKTWAITK